MVEITRSIMGLDVDVDLMDLGMDLGWVWKSHVRTGSPNRIRSSGMIYGPRTAIHVIDKRSHRSRELEPLWTLRDSSLMDSIWICTLA